MPTYDIQTPDGQKYTVSAANDAEAQKAIQSLMASRATAPPPSMATQAGQSARAVATGLAALPLMAADAGGEVVNLLLNAPRLTSWAPQPRVDYYTPSFGQAKFQQGLDALGFPAPGGTLAENATAAVSGAGLPIGVGAQMIRSAPQIGPSVARGIGQTLVRGPGTQVAGSVTGSLASDGAAALGGGPVIQTAAGMVGGAVVPGGGNIAGRARNVVDPLTEEGRKRAVGDALRRMANDPEGAQARLSGAKEIVPGSRPTTAQAAGDYGLAAAETPVFETSGQAGARAQRIAEQNAARNAYLDRKGITEDVASLLDGKAEKVAGPLREAAFDEAAKPTLGPVRKAMAAVIRSETYVRPEVKQAIKFAGEQLAEAAGKDGSKLDVRRLYEARKTISQAIAGKYDSDKSSLRLAARELMAVRDAIDESLDAATQGGYGKYMERYSRVAQVKEGVDNAVTLRQKATSASPEIQAQDPTAQYGRFLSQPAMAKALQAALRDKGTKLLPSQQRALDLVLRDLDRAATTSNAAARSPGSNTARNLTMSYVLGKVLTDSLADNSTAKALAKPLQAVYGLAGTEQEMSRILAEAMLDPKIASQLLAEANMRNAQRLANSLAEVARRGAVGGTTGALATQQ